MGSYYVGGGPGAGKGGGRPGHRSGHAVAVVPKVELAAGDGIERGVNVCVEDHMGAVARRLDRTSD